MLRWKIKHNRVTCVHFGYDYQETLRARIVQERSTKVINLKLYCPPGRLVQTFEYHDVARARMCAEEFLANSGNRRGG